MNLSHLPAVHSSQSVDRLLSVDMTTTSLAKPPPDKTKSFESIVESRLKSPSIVFASNETGEPGLMDLPTINQATEKAAITSNRLAKHLPMPPPTPPAFALSQADKASQSIMESIIPSVNRLPKSSTPAQISSIPETPISACSSIQPFLGNAAERGIDASGDWPYWVDPEPCQSTIKPLQGTEDSCIPSYPNQTSYEHSFPHDNMGGIGSENNNDGPNDGDDSSLAHNDAEVCETGSSEKEAADYDSEQPVHKRRRTRQSLATNTPPYTDNNITHGETSGSKENAADYDSVQLPRKRIKANGKDHTVI
ncbi:hypothetical protein H0G86_011855 [Trichoderma simmonsii]|uniref:Uncharacterized protein n=1 Tax=Trichoderma simmonsii TaxID=1491479 RepID=A0A8G0LMX1_9HYPO|nr:hypothetical protein H0G86_011855 [Trichoderma simmonsii]